MLDKIKQLRQQTGLGVHDIKRALEEAEGDATEALILLKKWGLDARAKKASRTTDQGLIEAYVHQGRLGALVEVNCETDFVARNDEFKQFAKEIAMQVASMGPADVEALLEQEYFRDPTKRVSALVGETVAKLGENIQISRFERFELGQ